MKTATKTKQSKINTDRRHYELYLIVAPEAISDNVSEMEKELESILQKHGAETKKRDKFTKNELAYPIKETLFAYTGSFYFTAEPGKVPALKNDLKNSDVDMLRWMVTVIKEETSEPDTVKMHSLEEELEAVEKAVEEVETDSEKEEGKSKAKKKKTASKSEKKRSKKKTKKSSPDSDKASTVDDIDKKLDEIMGNL